MTRRPRVACSQLLSLENMMWQTTGHWSLCDGSAERRNLVVEDDIEEGAVDV